MSGRSGSAGGAAPYVRGAWCGALIAGLAFAALALAGAGNALLTGLCIGTGSLAAAACVARGVAQRDDRGAWLLLAAAIAALCYTATSYCARADAAVEFPSAADLGSIGYPLAGAAFVMLARHELSAVPRALWLDAAIGGLALAAAGGAVVDLLLAGDDDPGAGAGGQLLYVAGALVLAGFVLVAWGLGGFRRSALLLLAIGAAGMAASDAAYVVRLAGGEAAWPPLLATVWVLALVAMAGAAVTGSREPPGRREPRWSLVLVPVAAALVAVAIHQVDYGGSGIAVALATAVLALAVARLAISLIDNGRAEERRRRAEQERHAREQAERANREKTVFLSRLSHEMRTPLNSMLGFAQLLADEVDPGARADVERIQRAGDHLCRLIDDLLDLSLVESGQAAIRIAPVDLDAAVGEAVALIEPMAGRHGVNVARRDGRDRPAGVAADPQRLKQCLLNLLSNAIKHGAAGGEVVVGLERSGPYARVTVADRGPGIPAEDLPRLFTPFERGHARGRGVAGSGIGLALTKTLVEAMGGRIGVDTGPGGTSFHVDLVAAAPVGPPRPQVPAQTNPVSVVATQAGSSSWG